MFRSHLGPDTLSGDSPNLGKIILMSTLLSTSHVLKEHIQTASPVSPTKMTPGRSSRHTLKTTLPRRACRAVTTLTLAKATKGKLRNSWDLPTCMGFLVQCWAGYKTTCLTLQSASISTNPITYSSGDSPFTQEGLISTFYRWRNWGSEKEIQLFAHSDAARREAQTCISLSSSASNIIIANVYGVLTGTRHCAKLFITWIASVNSHNTPL